jgi:hypothetical protein
MCIRECFYATFPRAGECIEAVKASQLGHERMGRSCARVRSSALFCSWAWVWPKRS